MSNLSRTRRVNPARILSLISICIISTAICTLARAADSDDEPVPKVDAKIGAANLNKKELSTPTDTDIPLTAKVANLAGRVPLASTFRVKERILKLAQFSTGFKQSLNTDFKIGAPLDQMAVLLFFVVCSYLPSLLLVCLLGACGCKVGGTSTTSDPTQFQYNMPEMGELSIILKVVQDLQKDVKAIQEGGVGQGNNNSVPSLTLDQFNSGLSKLINVQQQNMRNANQELESKVDRLEQQMQVMLTHIENQTISSLPTSHQQPNELVQSVPQSVQGVRQPVPQLPLKNGPTSQQRQTAPQQDQQQKRNTPDQDQEEEYEYYDDEEETEQL